MANVTWRRRSVWITVGVVVAIGIGSGWYATTRGDGNDNHRAGGLPPATATVTREDLQETQQEDGTLGYGDEQQLGAGQKGIVTWLPAAGRTISRGHSVYKVDNLPAPLFYGDLPFYRTLRTGVSDGPDVHELEENLHALGYSGFTVDDTFTDNTDDAVRAWQDDRGLDETGVVSPGQVVVAPGAVRISDQKCALGDPTAPGKPVLGYTTTTHTVSVALDVSDQQLASDGGRVTVQLPDGKTVPGTVTGIGTVAQPAPSSSNTGGGDSSQDATITVTITLTDQHAAGSLDQAPVEVNFVSDRRKNVLTVPVEALLALREGGYGVQVVRGNTATTVAVKTGLFTETRVQISGGGLTEGTKVGVPTS